MVQLILEDESLGAPRVNCHCYQKISKQFGPSFIFIEMDQHASFFLALSTHKFIRKRGFLVYERRNMTMGSNQSQVAALVTDKKLNCFAQRKLFLTKTKQSSFSSGTSIAT